ncbi:hypothetical protein STRCR_0272 [Streptococcus criceti HS-6]|uniref:Uncharacterized protein n=1 Tax=Streptococcus criceti HS-6 TaxID=873449 RepID=G5JP40_STRCG|nr:hypothetical protein STRCR_0272 [Streptococcus criceti HS-6]
MTPASHPVWIKRLIFTLVSLFEILVFGLMSKVSPISRKEQGFGLTEKIYLPTIFFAMAVYTLGIGILTPDSQPAWIKQLFIGGMFFLLLLLGGYFCFKKTIERPDERFYQDLAKAATLCLVLMIGSLLGLTIITSWFPFSLTPGALLIYLGALLNLFDVCFWIFEKGD